MAPARSIASLFARWRIRVFRSRSHDPRHALGRRGEKQAARYLKRLGYKVLYRQFRAPGGGEADIVCRDGDALVFVEVKTRASLAYGRPSEAVGIDKQRLIIRAASAWLRMLPEMDVLYRFDVVEVLVSDDGKMKYELVRNAFIPSDWEMR